MNSSNKIICLDIETTGINQKTSEILQLSIINYDGEVLFNEYIKPDNARSWPQAEKINHISPRKVANAHHLGHYASKLHKIFSNAEIVVTYNGNCFDIPILVRYGFVELKQAISYDVMKEFKKIHGSCKKLSACANYYGYNSNNYHDSLEDVRATLFCFRCMVDSPSSQKQSKTSNSSTPQLRQHPKPVQASDGPSTFSILIGFLVVVVLLYLFLRFVLNISVGGSIIILIILFSMLVDSK